MNSTPGPTVTGPSQYFVVEMSTSYASLAEAVQREPDMIAAHVARSRELHERGALLMAGAFLDTPDPHLEQHVRVTANRRSLRSLGG